MNARRRRLRAIVATAALTWASLALPAVLTVSAASAQESESPTREAAKHFQRGVTLYGEADYHAALVEFRRAYALAPNAAVLYNVAETEYQLQDYAGALTTFRRYLAESGPADGRRAEVDSNIEVLRTRVGHVSVSTAPAGADVTIDDQPIGKTPLAEPALVGIGRRKVVATMAGRPPVTRYVDVAADDNVSLTLQLPPPVDGTPASAPAATVPSSDVTSAPRSAGPTLRAVGWVATGVFAAGAVTFGVLANKASSDLKAARNTFGVTSSSLNHDANLTTTYAILADSLAAAAIVVGGITLISTLSASPSSAPARGSTGATRVVLAPTSAELEVTF